MTFGEELIRSAREALAIAKGRAEPAAVFVPETVGSAGITTSDGTDDQPLPSPSNPLA
jgi:hypothetical protein